LTVWVKTKQIDGLLLHKSVLNCVVSQWQWTMVMWLAGLYPLLPGADWTGRSNELAVWAACRCPRVISQSVSVVVGRCQDNKRCWRGVADDADRHSWSSSRL